MAAVGGCGGGASDNGEAKKTGAEVAKDAAAATRAAGSAHIVGKGKSEGKDFTLDLKVEGDNSSGTGRQDGFTFEIRRVNGVNYVKGPTQYWKSQGASEATIATIADKWVSSTKSTADSYSLGDLTDGFDDDSDNPFNPTVTKGSVAGKKAVVLTKKDGSELYVAATGKPIPLREVDKGDDPGDLMITQVGEKFHITAPEGAIPAPTG